MCGGGAARRPEPQLGTVFRAFPRQAPWLFSLYRHLRVTGCCAVSIAQAGFSLVVLPQPRLPWWPLLCCGCLLCFCRPPSTAIALPTGSLLWITSGWRQLSSAPWYTNLNAVLLKSYSVKLRDSSSTSPAVILLTLQTRCLPLWEPVVTADLCSAFSALPAPVAFSAELVTALVYSHVCVARSQSTEPCTHPH